MADLEGYDGPSVPVRYLVPWDENLFRPVEGPDGLSAIDLISITEFSFKDDSSDGPILAVGVELLDEVVLEVPGLGGTQLVLGPRSRSQVAPGSDPFADSRFDVELAIRGPLALRLSKIVLALRIHSGLMRPVTQGADGKWSVITDPDGEPLPFEARLSGIDVAVDADGDLEIGSGSTAPGLSLDAFQIGETGIVVEVKKPARLHLSRKASPPAGLQPGWRGVFIEQAFIHLPHFKFQGLPSGLEFQSCSIGNGGFSGNVAGVWQSGLTAELGGATVTLQRIELTFVQNTLTASEILGTLELPFFEQTIGVEIGIGLDGTLSVALSAIQPPGVVSDSGLITFKKDGLLELTLDSIRFEIDDGLLTVKLSGQITPLAGADKGFMWPTFDVQEISINSRGEVNVKGGWIDLPKAYTLDFHLFKLEITKFGIGRTEEGEKFIGFNGGLDLVKRVPAGVSVEGLRITWTDPTKPRITMKKVGVELEIANTLEFKGAVSYEEKGPSLRAFTGELTLKLPAMNNLGLDAKVVFGSDLDANGKRFKYFALYFEGELGTGFPLWSTGLALYGFAGLVAIHYAPDKPPEWLWYSIDKSKSWFHKPPRGVTDLVRKWAPEKDAFGFGAGAEIGTFTDGGRAFNGKFLLLVLLPGPVFMIDGRGNILKDRSKLSEDQEPLFHSLVVLDLKAGYFLIGLDAQWKNDEQSGRLMHIGGSAEAHYAFNDPRAWYINLGKEPMEQRIQATFAQSFRANSYFMLNARRLALGVWIGRQDQYRFGPVSARLEAWLDANAVLSFHPVQLNAALWLHGLLEVKLWKLQLGIGVDARLAAEVFKPFHIVGSLRITIETRLKDFSFEIRFEIGPRVERPQIPGAFKDVGVAHLKSTAEWALLPSGAPPVVPMDGRPYLTFEHPVHDKAGVGTNPAPDPGWVIVGDPASGKGSARVRYTLEKVVLDRLDGDWTPVAGRSSDPKDIFLRPLYGSWAAVPPNPGAGGGATGQNRLMVWAKMPFELTDKSPSWNSWIADNLPNYPCPVVVNERVCIDWEDLEVDTAVSSPWSDGKHPEIQVSWSGGPRTIAGHRGGVDGQHKGIRFPARRREGLAFVANESDNTVSVIDTVTDTVVGPPIPVGRGPHALAVTPDGSKVLVTNAQDSTVMVIDTDARTVTGAPIKVQAGPKGIAIRPDGSKAYVTSTGTSVVSVIDLATNQLSREIKMPEKSHGIVMSPDGSRAYVAHPQFESYISAIDLTTDTISYTVRPAETAPTHLAVTPNGARVYIAGPSPFFLVLETAARGVQFVRLLPEIAQGLAISPDGSRQYLSYASGKIEVIGPAPSGVVPVGSRPSYLAVTPDGRKLYVANTGSGTVTVIDTATNAVIAAGLPVGASPQGIAISPIPVMAPPAALAAVKDVIRQEWVNEPVEADGVEIEVPEGTAVIEVLFYQQTGRPTGEVVEPWTPEVVIAEGSLLRFDVDALRLRALRRVRIRSEQEWLLMRVCIVRPAVPGGLVEVRRVHDQLAQSLSVWGQPEEVLAPFTRYRLRATVRREVEGMGKLGDWRENAPLELARVFETSGPPGLATFSVPAGAHPERSATGLEDLTRYVAQTVPPTLTPPNARPRLSRPNFRAYDRGVELDVNYVDRMYELAGRDLAVQIYDADDRPARGVDGGLAVLANPWRNAAKVQLGETRKRWIEMLDAATCLPVHLDPETFPRNKTLAAASEVLDGDTLYEARLVPLLLRAPLPTPGGAWSVRDLRPGVPMLTRGLAADVLARVVVRPAPAGAAGVAFRLDSDGHYEFSIDAQKGRRTLSRVSGGASKELAGSGFAYDANETYRFSIEAIGSRLRVEQEGEPVFDVEDAALRGAGLGLFPWTAGQPLFRDLSVYDFRKGAPVAYRFQFTTSKYVDFFHQIHSFQDETWPGTLPEEVDLASLAAPQRDLTAPASEEEARAYDTLADAVLGAAARQLPPGLEAIRVRQGNAEPALLVRGSEPIDWRRTTLRVFQPGVLPRATVTPGRIKLAEATFGALTSGSEIVTVLLREALDPTGHRIEVRVPDGPVLLEEGFEDPLSSAWVFEEDGQAAPPWRVSGGELLAPDERAAALGGGLNGPVYALAVAGGELYAAGAFQKAGDQTARRVARWDGAAWSPLGVGLNGAAFAVAVVGDEVYVGGQFTRAGGAPAANIAVWNRVTQTWSPLGSGANGVVLALAVQGNGLFAGGRFTTAGGVTVNRMARWDLKARTWSALGSGLNSRVNALAVRGRNVYAAGAFTLAGGAPASRVAAWNGSRWAALGAGFNGEVLALATAGGALWAGGLFTQAEGKPASRVAFWDGRRWSAAGEGLDGPVRALALSGNVLYAAGGFLAAGGAPASRVARWSGSGAAWAPVAGGADGEMRSLSVAPGAVYLGGDFSTVGGAAMGPISRVEAGGLRSALAGDAGWDDYRLSLRLTTGGWGTTELLFRHQGDRFYALRCEGWSGKIRLLKVVSGQETALWEGDWTGVGREALLTVDCLGERLAGFLDDQPWFQVLDAGISSGRVGLRVQGGTATRVQELRVAAPLWALWYAFEKERKRAAGTRFEVRKGAAVPALPPPEPGVLRKFIGSAGQAPDWPLEGVDLRLVAPDGKVEHARRFLPPQGWPGHPHLIRNADGTGFFLLPGALGPFAESSCRLAFTYELDKPGGEPVLSRAGSRTAERATIDVP